VHQNGTPGNPGVLAAIWQSLTQRQSAMASSTKERSTLSWLQRQRWRPHC